MKLLFVCSGNVSRSFLAEVLLRNELRRRNINHVEVSSAGLHAYPGSPCDSKMLEYLIENDMPSKTHESQQMTEQEAEWADKIIVMEQRHADEIFEAWPDAAGKVSLLGQYVSAGPVADDILDPYKKSSFYYRNAISQITMAIKNLAGLLTTGQI